MSFRIVFMGTPEFAVPSLDALVHAGHEVAAVVSQPDTVVGRAKEPSAPPVKRRALELGLQVYQPKGLRSPKPQERLRSFAPQLIVVVAYGKILPREVLQIPTHGCVNVHGSLLPQLRGAAPIQWAIARGHRVTGITTMLMDEGMDTGPMLQKRELAIGEAETAAELSVRLASVGAELLVETLSLLEAGRLQPQPQPSEGITYAPILRKEDGNLDWSASADELAWRVRGFWPWPGAVCLAPKGEPLKIHRARAQDEPAVGHSPLPPAPGTVLRISADGVLVAAGSGALLLQEVQQESRKRLGAGDFARGYRLAVGDRFGQLPAPQPTPSSSAAPAPSEPPSKA